MELQDLTPDRPSCSTYPLLAKLVMGSLTGVSLNQLHTMIEIPDPAECFQIGFCPYTQEMLANFIKLQHFIVCHYFVQKSLPLLDSQIKESHQKATEELRQCGANVPSSDTEKMFFLIEVRITSIKGLHVTCTRSLQMAASFLVAQHLLRGCHAPNGVAGAPCCPGTLISPTWMGDLPSMQPLPTPHCCPKYQPFNMVTAPTDGFISLSEN